MKTGFAGLKIQAKLLVIFGGIISIGALITAWTVITINGLDRLSSELYQAELEVDAALSARNLLKEMEISELSFVLTGDEYFLHENERHSTDVDLFLRYALIRAEQATVGDILFQFEREKAGYEESLATVVEAVEKKRVDEAKALALESAEHIEGMVTQADEIIQLNKPAMDDKVAQSNRQVVTSLVVGASSLVLFLLLALWAGTVINRQVARPIQVLIAAATDVESGCFTPASLDELVNRKDEVGNLARSFVQMAGDIQSRRRALSHEAEQIRQKLEQI